MWSDFGFFGRRPGFEFLESLHDGLALTQQRMPGHGQEHLLLPVVMVLHRRDEGRERRQKVLGLAAFCDGVEIAQQPPDLPVFVAQRGGGARRRLRAHPGAQPLPHSPASVTASATASAAASRSSSPLRAVAVCGLPSTPLGEMSQMCR